MRKSRYVVIAAGCIAVLLAFGSLGVSGSARPWFIAAAAVLPLLAWLLVLVIERGHHDHGTESFERDR